MSDRLREYGPFGRKYITWLQQRAGEMWAGDWQAGNAGAKHRRMDRAPGGGSAGGGGFDMGGIAAIRGKRAASMLGSLFQIAHGVCVENRPARDFTNERGERDEAAMPMLRLALDTLVAFYNPDMPDDKAAHGGGGSATAEWQDDETCAETAAVVAGKKRPKRFGAVLVHCFVCRREWPYGENLPECGRARCRAPGSMVLSVRTDD